MATILGIKKAKQVIRLDDSEDSPEFTLDLTSKSIDKKTSYLKSKFAKYLKTYNKIEANAAVTDEELKQLAAFWKDVICTLLGKGAYQTIFDYVSDGEDLQAEDLVIVMAPIVMYLIEQVAAVSTMNGNKMYARYLGTPNAPDLV